MRKLFLAIIIPIALMATIGLALATINSSTNKVIALGNGSTTQFTFSFVGDQPGYISVIYTDSSGNMTTLTPGPGPTQYQLSLNPAVSPGLWGIGGMVTYDPNSTPIAVGTSLTIIRTLPLVQNISLLNLASLSALASAAETGMDQLEMQIQQLGENLSRVVAGPVSDPPGLNYTLPSVAIRANNILCFDSMGNVGTCSTAPEGVISSAMQPVVGAATLALGRTAFGLGSMATENINGGTCGGASIQDDGSNSGVNGFGYARVAPTTVADSTNQTVTCNFHFTQRITTGPITYTLPRANTLFGGYGFWIFVLPNTDVATITPNANDNFVGQSSGASITLLPGTWSWITTNAASNATWYVGGNANDITPSTTPPIADQLAVFNGIGNQVTPTNTDVIWAVSNAFYVGGTGANDSNDCLSATVTGGHGPCATITHTVQLAYKTNQGFGQASVNLAAGTYVESVALTGCPFNSQNVGTFNCLTINGSGPSTIWDNQPGQCFTLDANYGSSVIVNNMTLLATDNGCAAISALYAQLGGQIVVGIGIIDGGAQNAFINVENASLVGVLGNVTVTGGGNFFINCIGPGQIGFGGNTITIQNGPAFFDWINLTQNCSVNAPGVDWFGAVTGTTKYNISGNAVLNTGGACGSIPGATGGSLSTGGQCY